MDLSRKKGQALSEQLTGLGVIPLDLTGLQGGGCRGAESQSFILGIVDVTSFHP